MGKPQPPRRRGRPVSADDHLPCGNARPTSSLKGQSTGGTWMSRNSALVLVLALGSLILPAPAFAQLTPPAGSAGAGNSAISGVPFGPANPRVLSDPSGIGNASLIPPLRTNSPAPPVSYGSVNSLPPARTRVVAPPYAGASQRIISAHNGAPRSKAPARSPTGQHVHGDLPGVLERV